MIMSNSKLWEIICIYMLINTCDILNVEAKEKGFSIIRHDHGINYLQYIGLIPASVKCLKWGYRTTYIDAFKLEIVCLQEPTEHLGSCPIWQDCLWRPYYNRIGYYLYSCSFDNDCANSCKCCYSLCSGTFTCTPAINRRTTTATPVLSTTTTEGIVNPPTGMPSTTETTVQTTFTTTQDVASPNYDVTTLAPVTEEEIQIELEYDSNSEEEKVPPPQGPNILQEYEDNSIQIEDIHSKEDDLNSVGDNTELQIEYTPHIGKEDDAKSSTGSSDVSQTDSTPQIGSEGSKGRAPTPEPSLIRTTRPEIIDEEDEEGSGDDDERPVFVGIDRNVFRDTDDENMVIDEAASGDSDENYRD